MLHKFLIIFFFCFVNSYAQTEFSVFLNKNVTSISGSNIDFSGNNLFEKTLSANTTFTFSNFPAYQWVSIFITNPSTYTITWPSAYWQGVTVPTQSVNNIDEYRLIKIGNIIYGYQNPGFSIPVENTSIFYVSNDGDDNNDGHSELTPWQTLNKVNATTFEPGDSIFFKGGDTFTNCNLVFSQAGTNVAPIVITSYGSGNATLDNTTGNAILLANGIGGYVIKNLNIVGNYDAVTRLGSDTSSNHIGIHFYNFSATWSAPSVILDSLIVSGFFGAAIKTGSDTTSVIVTKTKGYDSIRIKNSTISDCGLIGLSVYGFRYRDIVFSGNKIYNIRGIPGTHLNAISGFPGNGISISYVHHLTVTRNLIYNCGEYATYGGCGLVTGKTNKIIVSHNEIYGIKSQFIDGDGIDFDHGSDSCIAENNYIHNCDGVGVLISGSTGFGPSEYNIIRNNIIKNCGTKFNQASITIYNESNTAIGNMIYNNTIVADKTGSTFPVGIKLHTVNTISTSIQNNIIIGDSIVFLELDSTNHQNLSILGNSYWSRGNKYYSVRWGLTTYTSMYTWQTATGHEMLSGNSTMKVYNPLLRDPFTLIDTINNAYLIDTLSNYKFAEGSLMRDGGVDNDSARVWSPNIADFYGGAVPKDGIYDIGAYEDTTTLVYTFAPLSQRVFGRDTSLISIEDKYIKDSLIAGLIADTLMSKMDALYFTASPNEYSAKFNILKDTFNLTAVSSPTFTAYQGFKGNGSSSYLQTGWIPSTHAVNYTLNDAGIGVYSRTDTTGSFVVLGALSSGNYVQLRLRNASNLIGPWINAADFVQAAYSSSTLGLFSANRIASSGAGSILTYKNGSLLASTNSTSTSLPANQVGLLALQGSTPSSYAPMQISAAYVSSSLTASNIDNLNRLIEYYMFRIGSIVTVPSAPRLILPIDTDTDVSTTPVMDWTTQGATHYEIQIDDNNDFSSPEYANTNVTASTVTSDLLSGGETYYWRVRGVNGIGTGSYSATSTFTTGDSLWHRSSTAIKYAADTQYIWTQYNAFEVHDDSVRMMYKLLPSGVTRIATSKDGTTFQNDKPVTTDLTADYYDQGMWRINDTTLYGFYHFKPADQHYRFVLNKSTNNGYDWVLTTDTFYTGSKSLINNSYHGEDVTAMDAGSGIYNVYFRDSTTGNLGLYPSNQTQLRTIALTTTTDFVDYTSRQVVIPKTRSNFANVNSIDYRKTFYNMTVIKIDTNWWGICNILQLRSDALENQASPTGTTEQITMRLYHSTDGIDWNVCNDSLPIVPLPSGINQQLGIPLQVGDSLYIYTIESPRRHNGADPTTEHFRIQKYSIAIARLNEYYIP